ncbi:hypothetical protein Tco_0795831 [Tanacetum coccineum]
MSSSSSHGFMGLLTTRHFSKLITSRLQHLNKNGVADRKTDLIEAARQWLFWESVFLKQLFDEATFSVSTTRRHQTYETYLITFDESPDAIKFSKPLVDNINIAENKRYSPDEYLHPYDPSQRYQTNSNDVSFIEPYECAELFFLETEVSSDQNGQTDQNDQSVQNDEILNDDHSEQIIDNLTNTKDIQISEHSSSPREEDISVKKYNSSPKSTLTHSISGAGRLTRAMAKELGAASSYECLFIDFLSEEEPKKVSDALQHPGWISIHVRHRDSRDRGGSIWELYRHILGILDDLGWRRRVEGGYEVVRGGLGVEVRVGEEWRGDGGRGCLRYGGGDSSGGRAQVGDGVHDNVWWVEVYDTVVVEYMDRGWVGGVESKGEDVRVTMSISDDLGRRGIVQLYDVDRCWGWKMIWRLRGCGFNELPTAERGVSKVVIVQAEGSPSLGAPTPSPVSPHPLHTSSSSDELIIRMVSFTMVRHQQIEADPSLSLYPPQRLIEKLHWNFYGSKRI